MTHSTPNFLTKVNPFFEKFNKEHTNRFRNEADSSKVL